MNTTTNESRYTRRFVRIYTSFSRVRDVPIDSRILDGIVDARYLLRRRFIY